MITLFAERGCIVLTLMLIILSFLVILIKRKENGPRRLNKDKKINVAVRFLNREV